MATYKQLKEKIKQLNLSHKWSVCKSNSDRLQQSLGGNSRTASFINIDGLSYGGHYFYADGNFVVDLVIHHQKKIHKMLKHCETPTKGIFHKDCYFRKLNIDEN